MWMVPELVVFELEVGVKEIFPRTKFEINPFENCRSVWLIDIEKNINVAKWTAEIPSAGKICSKCLSFSVKCYNFFGEEITQCGENLFKNLVFISKMLQLIANVQATISVHRVNGIHRSCKISKRYIQNCKFRGTSTSLLLGFEISFSYLTPFKVYIIISTKSNLASLCGAG